MKAICIIIPILILIGFLVMYIANKIERKIEAWKKADMERNDTKDQYNGKTRSGGLSPDTGPRH